MFLCNRDGQTLRKSAGLHHFSARPCYHFGRVAFIWAALYSKSKPPFLEEACIQQWTVKDCRWRARTKDFAHEGSIKIIVTLPITATAASLDGIPANYAGDNSDKCSMSRVPCRVIVICDHATLQIGTFKYTIASLYLGKYKKKLSRENFYYIFIFIEILRYPSKVNGFHKINI